MHYDYIAIPDADVPHACGRSLVPPSTPSTPSTAVRFVEGVEGVEG